jgi:hypothetical protein
MSFVGTGESTEVAGADDMDGKLEHVEERARWKGKAATSPDREMIPEAEYFNCRKMSGNPPRSRLSENRPSRPKDQQIFRERERCNQPRSHAALLRQFPGRCEAARRGRFA